MSFEFKVVENDDYAVAIGITKERVLEIAGILAEEMLKYLKSNNVTVAELLAAGAKIAQTPEELMFIGAKIGIFL